MSVRRGPFKLKVQLPENDEDSESGSECVASHEDTNDSDASSDRSSGGREIDATPNKKISSRGDEGSDVMEKQGERNNKKSRLSSSSSDEESDMEEKRSVQYDNSVSASDSSDDEDSDGEVKQDSQSDSSANYSDNSADEDSVLDEKRSMQNDNSASSSGSSNDEYSDVEMKQQSQHDNSASSSDSSSDEDSSLEEKHSTRNDKDRGDSSSSDSSRSGGSGEDSSASDFDSSQSESEEKPPPGKMKKSPIKVEVKKAVVSKTHATTTSAKRVLKRLRRPGKNNGEDSSNGDISDEDSSDEDSSDEDSPVALDLPPALKSSDNQEQEDSNTESEREEEEGSLDSDEDKDWPPRNDKEDEEDSKARRGKDDVVGDSDEEWLEELDEVKPRPRSLVPSQRKGINDLNQARYLMRNITSHVPLIEETAIRRGVKLSGPPLEFATTHQDEFARKFRWPQHFRNLRNRDFSQDPSDILEDHELLSVVRQADSSEERPPKESPLAQVPRPMVSVAAEALHRSLRKRRRSSDNEDSSVHAPSAVTLLNTARVGGQFGDRFVESLLSANGKAMQGIIDGDEDYDKRCWSSLPTKRKPIANWRFVLEHLRRTMGRSDHNDVVYPPMKQETLERITKRLKTLYGYTTQHEEYDVFADASPNANNNSVDIEE